LYLSPHPIVTIAQPCGATVRCGAKDESTKVPWIDEDELSKDESTTSQSNTTQYHVGWLHVEHGAPDEDMHAGRNTR
jgi:hypothetical protein